MERSSVNCKGRTAFITLFVITVMMLFPFLSASFAEHGRGIPILPEYSISDGRAPFGTISVPSDSLPFVSERCLRNRESDQGKAPDMPVCAAPSAAPAVITASFPQAVRLNAGPSLCGIINPKTIQKRE